MYKKGTTTDLHAPLVRLAGAGAVVGAVHCDVVGHLMIAAAAAAAT
jgi:hypothetical protein